MSHCSICVYTYWTIYTLGFLTQYRYQNELKLKRALELMKCFQPWIKTIIQKKKSTATTFQEFSCRVSYNLNRIEIRIQRNFIKNKISILEISSFPTYKYIYIYIINLTIYICLAVYSFIHYAVVIKVRFTFVYINKVFEWMIYYYEIL